MRAPQAPRADSGVQPVIDSLISFQGVTDNAGNVGGTTLRCGLLALEPSYQYHFVKILPGASNAAGQTKFIITHPAGTDTLTVPPGMPFTNPTGAPQQIVAGTPFVVLSINLGDLSTNANNILNLINAIFTLKETGGTITTAAAPGADVERDIYRVETPMGVFIPKKIQIDFSNNAAGDIIVLRERYRIRNGGALLLKDQLTFNGAVNPPLVNVELEPNRHGIQVTMQRTAGVQQNYDWCAFYED